LPAPARAWAAELLQFWFHELTPREWFVASPALDARVRRRFLREWRMLRGQPAKSFLTDPQSALAAVLLFDQVPRNIHRGTPLMFASDPLAREIVRGALAKGWDAQLKPAERQFLAMPLMHSEAIADQLLALRFYAPLGARYGWPFARSHYKMIARFGRFPHRNTLLGRKSTSAEKAAVAAGNRW
jgi:uncharacterized protein (DUF924 family)